MVSQFRRILFNLILAHIISQHPTSYAIHLIYLFPFLVFFLLWQVGNMIFWFIFCILGQPMCVLLYYHDLMNRKGKHE